MNSYSHSWTQVVHSSDEQEDDLCNPRSERTTLKFKTNKQKEETGCIADDSSPDHVQERKQVQIPE